MTPALGLVALVALGGGGNDLSIRGIPVCSNHAAVAVVRRAGCTLGDGRCWERTGGFGAGYVEKRLAADGAPAPQRLERIRPTEVRAGDVAVFNARAHYAYVEKVVKDEGGKPIAVDLAEFNFGTCWVDRDYLVTDRYKVESRRPGVPLSGVDGGFLRARRAVR
jgi:hypothetical protein